MTAKENAKDKGKQKGKSKAKGCVIVPIILVMTAVGGGGSAGRYYPKSTARPQVFHSMPSISIS